ncbi:hypothetical protein P8452_49816 [Trifolium repens]|nr:hypothetical protein P8452_49816 [Trifolium repens]
MEWVISFHLSSCNSQHAREKAVVRPQSFYNKMMSAWLSEVPLDCMSSCCNLESHSFNSSFCSALSSSHSNK